MNCRERTKDRSIVLLGCAYSFDGFSPSAPFLKAASAGDRGVRLAVAMAVPTAV